ncbi:MAG: GNVR domain-containing protein [Gallionella sp.]|nr:GNVR domain-containing protein [Gallionella sp.]
MDDNKPNESSTMIKDEEINLMEVLLAIAKHNRLIAKITLGAAVASVAAALLMTNIYTGKTVFLPPAQDTSFAGMLMGQLSGLGGAGGAAGGLSAALGLKNPNDIYVGMLQSNTVADRLISRFKLSERYETATLTDTRNQLAGKTKVTAGKDGLIVVEFDDEDAKFAADMANAYVEELSLLSQSLALTDAAQRSQFFEKQLKSAKEGLKNAEDALKDTQEKSGLISLDAQGKGIIEAVANLRAQIASKEVEIASMRAFATEQNPDYRQARAILASLNAQLAKAEKSGNGDQGGVMIPTGQLPEAGLEYVRKLRDVKYYEKLFELMTQQTTLAKIDMSKEPTSIQVIDKAITPDKKSKPKRALIVIMTTFMAALLGIFVAVAKELGGNKKQDPLFAERMGLLKRYLKTGK